MSFEMFTAVFLGIPILMLILRKTLLRRVSLFEEKTWFAKAYETVLFGMVVVFNLVILWRYYST